MKTAILNLPASLPESASLFESIPNARTRLRRVLGAAMAVGAHRPWSDHDFNRLALAVFRYQAAANPVYGTFVRNRGTDPDSIGDWREIPPVPTRAFKELPMVADEAAPVEATFRTSGTTRGEAGRGTHRVRDLSLYRVSAMTTAERFLRPPDSGAAGDVIGLDDIHGADDTHEAARRGGARTSTPAMGDRDRLRPGANRTIIRVLNMTPDPQSRPDSSLAHMFGLWTAAWDEGGGGYFADPDWALRTEELAAALDQAVGGGIPVIVAGTAFGFLAWLDESAARSWTLPPGSLLVETGGFKGRTRTVPRAELYRGMSASFGVPLQRIVNEYGMTEMLSQFYEPVLLEGGPEDPEERRHVGPPWVRTRILDPVTLEAVPVGEQGLLCHLDLANLDSVCAILTEDTGRAVGDGFRLEGRARGAEPRGCSLSMEALLGSA